MSDFEGLAFDATEIDPRTPFEVIPAGKYVAQMVASEIKPTRDGTSTYLWTEFEIIEGEYAGRKVWDRLCLWHANEQTRQIAQRNLSAICHATGKLRITSAEELHDIPLMLSVRVGKPSGEYDASNEIRGYSAVSGAAPPAAAKTTASKVDGRATAAAKPAPATLSAPAKRAGNPWDED